MFWNKKSDKEDQEAEETNQQDNQSSDGKVSEQPVELTPVTETDAEEAKLLLQEILNAMEYITTAVLKGIDAENNRIELEITGEEDWGKIIGRNGATLDALQHLCMIICSRKAKKRIRISLDANDYRKRREDALRQSAENTIIRVQETKQEITLEPMNPAERRIVHMVVAESGGVKSDSTGQEPYRKVVISPA